MILALPFLPYGRHTIEDDDIDAVVEVLKSDYLTTGPAVEAFERAFAEKVGTKHAVALSSGTAALHVATLALEIGPGDAVVVPSITFVATANAVRYVGAEVVFADVDAETGLMGPAELEAALARAGDQNVRAVFPVHLNGQPCNLSALAEIARARGLEIIEDACHALGGTVGEHRIGDAKLSRMAMFSLHPVKAIAMGEGGVLTTNDGNCAATLRRLCNHGLVHDASFFCNRNAAYAEDGRVNPWYYELHEPGFNYRASDIHCALGMSQLVKLDRFINRRQEIAALYDELLAPFAPVLRPVPRVEWGSSGWHLYAVQIDFDAARMSRAQLVESLREDGVGTQVHYFPVHRQPYYAARNLNLELPGAEHYYAHCLSLPLFPTMKDEDANRVADAISRHLGAVK